MKRADAERIASILVDLMAEQAEGLAGVEISGKKIAGIVAVMAKTPRFRGEEFSYEYSLVPADDNATGEIARLLKTRTEADRPREVAEQAGSRRPCEHGMGRVRAIRF